MSKKTSFPALIVFLVAALSLTACDIDDNSASPPIVEVSGNTLAEKLAWVGINLLDGGTYIITVNASETIAPQSFGYSNRSDVTIILRGGEAERIISFTGDGDYLFCIGSGVTMILDHNITLKGISDSDHSLVDVHDNGAIVMKAGSKITGHTSSRYGSGVLVYRGGTFTMDGGEVSGNTANDDYGGGVFVGSGGTFTMNGGKISGNTSSGVLVLNGGTFTMNSGEVSGNTGNGVFMSDATFTYDAAFTMHNGEISGNNASSGGGGVRVNFGTFIMNGGKISGNTAVDADGGGGVEVGHGTFTMNGGKISGNTSSSNGGGVCVFDGTFTMNGGEISGNTASSDHGGGGVFVMPLSSFTMNGGEISGNTAPSGGGVYVRGKFRIAAGTVYGSDAAAGMKNIADEGAALYLHIYAVEPATAEYGTWSGETWNKAGTLDTTDATVSVKDGVN